MEINIQGTSNSRSVIFYTEGIPIGSTLQTIPEEIESAISLLEDYCKQQQNPEQLIVSEANEIIKNIIKSFDSWSPDSVEYKEGDVVSYDGSLFKVNVGQGHTSQPNWNPRDAVSLFKDITVRQVSEETDTPGEWIQPTGGHDSYSKDDVVSYDGKVWISTSDNNVWVPGEYGWVEVE